MQCYLLSLKRPSMSSSLPCSVLQLHQPSHRAFLGVRAESSKSEPVCRETPSCRSSFHVFLLFRRLTSRSRQRRINSCVIESMWTFFQSLQGFGTGSGTTGGHVWPELNKHRLVKNFSRRMKNVKQIPYHRYNDVCKMDKPPPIELALYVSLCQP